MKMASRFALFCTLLLLGFSAQAAAVADEVPDDDRPAPVQPSPARPPPPPPAPPPVYRPTPPPPVVVAPVRLTEPFVKGYVDGYYIPFYEAELNAPPAPGSTITEGDGFGVKGMVAIGQRVRFLLDGEYEKIGIDEAEVNGVSFPNVDADVANYRFGPGLGFNPSPNAFIYGLAEFVGIETESGNFSDHEEGFGGFAGFRAATPNCLGIEGRAGYVDLENVSGPEFTLGGFWQFARFAATSLGVFADFRTAQFEDDRTAPETEVDTDEGRVGLRLHFQTPGTSLVCV